MSQEKMFNAAREGNPQVIAAMINKSLEAKGITVKASSNNGCLTVIAEAQEVPKQDIVVDCLRNGISKLQPSGISRVVVRGRVLGQTIEAWQEPFNVYPCEAETSSNQVNSTITHASSPIPSHSNSSRTLINNSKKRENLLESTKEIKTQGLKNPLKTFGWILFTIGSGMLLIGLTYDPTVPSGMFNTERAYNIGEINIKSTYTNTGGFLSVCGAIFITCTGNKIASTSERK